MRAGRNNDYVWIMTSRANPEHWARLCKVMGREELISDPRFATPNDRVKNHDALDAIITEWTRTRTKHEAMEQVGVALRFPFPANPRLASENQRVAARVDCGEQRRDSAVPRGGRRAERRLTISEH